jgi:hypothetical protein
MTRLSKSTREYMAKALVRHKLNDRADTLCAESAALFNAVLDARYDEATVKLMRQLEKREPSAFLRQRYLNVNARGMRISLGNTSIGKYSIVKWVPQTTERALLYGDVYSDIDLSEELTDRIATFALNLKRVNEDVETAYRRALGTLERFTTAKKLTKEWPEAMPIIGKLIPVEARTLPTVQLEAINDEFGLPPSDEKQAA